MTKRSKARRCQGREKRAPLKKDQLQLSSDWSTICHEIFKQFQAMIIEGTEKYLQTIAKKPGAQSNEIMITRDNNEETCTVSTAASSNNQRNGTMIRITACNRPFQLVCFVFPSISSDNNLEY